MNQPATHDELTIKFANLVFFGEIAAAQVLGNCIKKIYNIDQNESATIFLYDSMSYTQ